MGEARGRLAAAVLIAFFTGLVASVVVVGVARSRNYLCDVEDGYVSCPDGISYLVPHLVVAGAVATVVLVAGVLVVSRGLGRPERRGIAADLAVLAVLPVAALGGLLLLAAFGGSPAAALVGAALLLPVAVVGLARRQAWPLQPLLWLVLAAAGVAAAVWWDLIAVLTVPGAVVLVVGAVLAHESHQSQD